ncbi:NlpC/P60 family protein [Andreprevotia lacus DSM 23236]|jgi:cell wall-associated NlpC family hydrolase|uniref:NlpC/P60 family protein n=1 Tax=Andreprevotia lacus DSM 23236 TaxID=1121001 RepID=A0A1W1X9Q9_9NEIS|nr:C40 family peptidase [Andreprevotia lacus]SMC20554.1 NlpC/P60 family protein [Andreprevotia lacus DSM 23236]
MRAIPLPDWRCLLALLLTVWLAGCGTPPAKPTTPGTGTRNSVGKLQVDSRDRQEVVLYALGLLDVGYQFGGGNPEAGLDCSGLVRFVYKNALDVELPHNAAEIARLARPLGDRASLQAGDLVFFNTSGKPYSHVGIYLGDGKFIHAPSSKGKVKVESMGLAYFASRYQGGATLFAAD